jgi:hypothetical protein
MLNIIAALLILGNVQQLPAPNTPTPYAPIATVEVIDIATAIPRNEIYSWLSTAVANVNSLPNDPFVSNGTSIITADTGTQIFGYVRWLYSYNTAQELLGATLAPIGAFLYTILNALVLFAGISMTVTVITIIRRGISYILCLIGKLIPF